MSTNVRLNNSHSKDTTDRIIQNDFQDVAYAASVALTTKQNHARTRIRIGQATGALSLTIGVGSATTDPQVGDEVELWLSSDGTGRVVTFSTGFAPAGTLTMVANKSAVANFYFNGTAWVERHRSIGA
jgi:hypothetical protein